MMKKFFIGVAVGSFLGVYLAKKSNDVKETVCHKIDHAAQKVSVKAAEISES